jgi:Polysaccharide lyase
MKQNFFLVTILSLEAVVLAPKPALSFCWFNQYNDYICSSGALRAAPAPSLTFAAPEPAKLKTSFRPTGAPASSGIDYQAELRKVHAQIAADEQRLIDAMNAPPPSGGPAMSTPCGDVIVSYDMEDGFIPGSENGWSAFRVQEPAKILSDPDGNDFLRITATPADGGHGGRAERVRSETSVGSGPAAEGDIGTYSFSLRLANNAPESTVLWQLFQYGDPSKGGRNGAYAEVGDGTGPSVWISGGPDGIRLRNYYNGEADLLDMDLGKITTNQFVNIEVTVYWSLDPSLGRIDVWIDGELRGSMAGVPTMLSPLSHPSVGMHIGTYGDRGVGVVDFDNVAISSAMAGSSGCLP